MRSINTIIIHCTATPNGKKINLKTMEKDHIARGFVGIGYHYVINTDGTVTNTRPVEEVGAHSRGHNSHSIGVSLAGGVGGKDKLNPGLYTKAQWNSLKDLVLKLKARFGPVRICGHRDVSPDLDGDGVVEPHEWVKLCPSFSVLAWLGNDMEPLEAHVLKIDSPDKQT